MNLYLSPSLQEGNVDVFGVSETRMMNYIADAMVPYLKVNGIPYTRNNPSQSLSQVIGQSNAGNYDLHLALHSNAAPPAYSGRLRGSRPYHSPSSVNGTRAANIMAENMKEIYPLPNLSIATPTNELTEINRTRAPAVLYEIAFHDNYADSEWMHNNVQAIAENISKSVAEYYGKALIPVCISGKTPATSFTYNGAIYGQICNVSTSVNIRSQPNTSSRVVTKLANGTPVVVLSGNSNGWVLVRHNDTQGHISANYLCICNIPAGITPDARLGVVSTSGGNLNIRRSASASAPVIASAPNGSQLIVLGEQGNFYRVNYQGQNGYASKQYIRLHSV